jgi:hypothetical protein
VRGRPLLWALVGAAVVGSLVVKTEGVDFTVLEPSLLAVAGFVLLPGLTAFAIAWLVERAAPLQPWHGSRWLGLLALPALPALLAAPAFLLGGLAVLGLSRIDSLRSLRGRRLPRVVALGLVVAMIVAGGVDLTRDALRIL